MTALRDGWVDASVSAVAWPWTRPGAWELALYIPGLPVQKGSMKGRVVGRGPRAFAQLFHDNEKEQQLWVRQACAALAAADIHPPPPWEGPVWVWCQAVLPRPKYLGGRAAAMVQKPDADKLARSVLDVLTAAGVYGDDKQVVAVECCKRYADPGEGVGLHLRATRVAVAVGPGGAA